jgi:flagellar biosynthetic protein FliR
MSGALDAAALLAVARAAGLVSRAPGFSHPSVPPPVRAGFALALGFAVAPSVAPARLELFALVFAVAANVATGAAIGFGASLLYDGAYFAGRTIDDYLGVRGSVPGANVTSAQAFGRLWSSVFLIAFVMLDGWVPVVGALAASFAHVPASGFAAGDVWWRFALALPHTLMRAAFVVATPAIAVAVALHLALAAVARVVPRFSSASIAFPAVFGGALLVTLLAVPLLAPLGAGPWLVLPWSAR